MSTTQIESTRKLELPAFTNEPLFPGCDDPQVREAFPRAIAEVRAQLGRDYPLYINGHDVVTGETIESINPGDPDEVIGRICQAGTKGVEDASL